MPPSVRILAALLALGSLLPSQRFSIRHYTDADGLPSTHVWDVEQGPDGRMWFGTHVGVTCYDGAWWELQDGPARRAQGHLCFGPDGRLWVLTAFTPIELSSYDGSQWIVHPSPPIEKAESFPTALVALDADTVLIGTSSKGLAKFTKGAWSRLPFRGRLDYRVQGLALLGRHVLLSSDGELWLLDRDHLEAEPRHVTNLPGKYPLGMVSDGDSVWIVGQDWAGRWTANGFEQIPTDPSRKILPIRTKARVAPDGHGGIYVSSNAGLRYIHADGTQDDLDSSTGLPFNSATGVKRDREGNIWLSSQRGICKIVPSLILSYHVGTGLFHDEVSAICRRADGTMVLGHPGGLTLFHRRGSETISFDFDPDISRVMDLEPDSEGNVWIAAAWGGLGRLSPDNELQFFHEKGIGQLHSVVQTRHGLLVGGGNGLWRFRDGHFERPFGRKSTSFGAIRRLATDPDGTLWISSRGYGVWRVKPDGGTHHWTSSNGAQRAVYTVHRMASGRRLIGSDGGLLEIVGDELVRCEEWPIELPVYFITSGIHEDELWIGTSKGVYHRTAKGVQQFGTAQGLAGSETNRDAYLVTEEGTLWVGTDRGLSYVAPREKTNRRPPPTLALIYVSHAGYRLPRSDAGWRTSETKGLLTWGFRAISFFDEDRVRFRFRLEGLQDKWVGPVHLPQRTVHFPSLPPGSYRLHLVAIAADGQESEELVSAPLLIPAPIYRQNWFFALLGLATLGLTWLGFKTVAQRRYAQRLEHEVDQRTRQVAASEQAQAEARRQLELVLGSIADGVSVSGPDGKIFLWNDAAERLTGIGRDEAIGRRVPEVLGNGREIPREGHCQLEASVRGEERTFEASSARFGPTGDGAVVAFRDVTDRQRIERDLADRQRLESLGLLAGGIAHDFNNYLSVILGTLELLDGEPDLPDEHRKQVRLAGATLERAVSLTQQLLTFSTGGAPVRAAVDLEKMLHDAIDFALSGATTHGKLETEPDLPRAWVDEGQIGQVLHNLLLNARQAMPEGGTVTIRARRARALPSELEDGDWIAIEVEDDGPGILPEVQQRVFDPFFSTRRGGTGLGLSVAHSVVIRHGGQISLWSSPGRGTRFTIILPAAAKDTAPRPTTPSVECNNSASILLMDDEPAIRSLMDRMLRHLGHKCSVAAEGQEAIDLYSQAMQQGRPYDIALLDITVAGGLGGKETARRLLEMDPEACLVAVSGYSNDAVLSDFAGFGFRAALTKPFPLKKLKQMLAELLS